jgi:hypothetical protein
MKSRVISLSQIAFLVMVSVLPFRAQSQSAGIGQEPFLQRFRRITKNSDASKPTVFAIALRYSSALRLEGNCAPVRLRSFNSATHLFMVTVTSRVRCSAPGSISSCCFSGWFFLSRLTIFIADFIFKVVIKQFLTHTRRG